MLTQPQWFWGKKRCRLSGRGSCLWEIPFYIDWQRTCNWINEFNKSLWQRLWFIVMNLKQYNHYPSWTVFYVVVWYVLRSHSKWAKVSVYWIGPHHGIPYQAVTHDYQMQPTCNAFNRQSAVQCCVARRCCPLCGFLIVDAELAYSPPWK